MTYNELIEKEPRLKSSKACFEDGLLRCSNCEEVASASLSIAAGWIGCGPCITGEADSLLDSLEGGDVVVEGERA